VSSDLNQGFFFFFSLRSLRSVEPFGYGAFFSLELVWSEPFLMSVAGRCVRVCALVVLIASLYAWIFGGCC
jgi:hypothetical protein